MNDVELDALEQEVSRALATDDRSQLRIIGHGEISIVLGWPPDEPTVVAKRLPPFENRAAFDAYRDVVLRYIDHLRSNGLRIVDTDVHHVDRDDGRVVGFHVQPLLPEAALGTEILRTTAAEAGHPIVPAVVDAVSRVTTDRVGVDAQMSNWVWVDGEPWQLDLTTPFLLDADGQPAFDLSPFLAMLPAVVRPVVRREMVKLIHRWTTPRGSLLDLAANLLKEQLDDWLDPVLECVNERVDPPITPDEAARVHTEDRRLWPLLFRLEHANRWWQRNVRRRPFEFLLPERTTYEERPLDRDRGR
jgi:hypothetical protein